MHALYCIASVVVWYIFTFILTSCTHALCYVFAPSLDLCEAQVLRALPYPRRFALYAHWREAAYGNETAPELLFAKAEAMRRTKYFQARL